MAMTMGAWTAIAVVAATAAILRVLHRIIWQPLRLLRIMAKQGVHGPPFRPLVGNLLEAESFRNSLPEIMPFDYSNHSSVAPQNALYRPKYGKRYVYCWGSDVRLSVGEPEFVKQVLHSRTNCFKRAAIEISFTNEVVGRGLFAVEGPKWTVERRTLDPFFHTTALKRMVGAMVDAAGSEMKKWEKMVAEAGGTLDLDIEPKVHIIAGKVLTYTAFSSAEFERVYQIFKLQAEVATGTINALRSLAYWIPGASLFPTEEKRHVDKCKAKMDSLLHEIIQDRIREVKQGKTSHGTDFLGRMLAAASEGMDPNEIEFNYSSVFNNFKLFYYAGQDTVSHAGSFLMFLLARHQGWQEKARKEVLEVVVDEENLDSNVFSRLKVVTMIINEVLRLYPPIPALVRVAKEDLYIDDLLIPKGMTIELALGEMYTDPKYWGEDAGEFNPLRFANGVSNACTHPQAFVPFAVGPKHCIGDNFSMMELKIIMVMLLRRFRLSMSPSYKHHPTLHMLQQPKYGAHVILTTL